MENNVGLITVRTVILLATAAMLSHAAELGFSWTGARRGFRMGKRRSPCERCAEART